MIAKESYKLSKIGKDFTEKFKQPRILILLKMKLATVEKMQVGGSVTQHGE